MKLLTHNMLTCNVKGVKNGYPLRIEAKEVANVEAEFNPIFVQNMLPKLNWKVLRGAALSLGVDAATLPEDLTDELKNDDACLKAIHHALVEVVVVEGALVCPESGRKFLISNGIPNMLLNEDEV